MTKLWFDCGRLTAVELKMLRQVCAKACSKKDIDPASEEAELVALSVVSLYQTSEKNPAALLHLVLAEDRFHEQPKEVSA